MTRKELDKLIESQVKKRLNEESAYPQHIIDERFSSYNKATNELYNVITKSPQLDKSKVKQFQMMTMKLASLVHNFQEQLRPK